MVCAKLQRVGILAHGVGKLIEIGDALVAQLFRHFVEYLGEHTRVV